jgi:hypothetical protein
MLRRNGAAMPLPDAPGFGGAILPSAGAVPFSLSRRHEAMVRIATTLFLMLLPATAFADRQAAMTCAAGLTPQGRAAFDATVAKLAGGGANADTIRAEMAAMVKAGTPREDVQAAAGCLKMFRQ